MGFRKFQAERIFTGRELLDADQVLITDEKGKVADIVSVKEAGEDIRELYRLGRRFGCILQRVFAYW